MDVYIYCNDAGTPTAGVRVTVTRLDGQIDRYTLSDACTMENSKAGVVTGTRTSFVLRKATAVDPMFGVVGKQLKIKKLMTFNFEKDANAAEHRKGLELIFRSFQLQYGRLLSNTLVDFPEHMRRFMNALQKHTTWARKPQESVQMWVDKSIPLALSPSSSTSAAPSTSSTVASTASSISTASSSTPSSSTTFTSQTLAAQPLSTLAVPPSPSVPHLSSLDVPTTHHTPHPLAQSTPSLPSVSSRPPLQASANSPPLSRSFASTTSILASPHIKQLESNRHEPDADLKVDTIQTIRIEAYCLGHTYSSTTKVGIRIFVVRLDGSTDYYMSEVSSWKVSLFDYRSWRGLRLTRVSANSHAFDDQVLLEGHIFPIVEHDFSEDSLAVETRKNLKELLRTFKPTKSDRIKDPGNFVDAICSLVEALSVKVKMRSEIISVLGDWLTDHYNSKPGTRPTPSSSLPSSLSSSSLPSSSTTTLAPSSSTPSSSSSAAPSYCTPSSPSSSSASDFNNPLALAQLSSEINFAEIALITVSAYRLNDIHRSGPEAMHGISILILYRNGVEALFIHEIADRRASKKFGIQTSPRHLDHPSLRSPSSLIFEYSFLETDPSRRLALQDVFEKAQLRSHHDAIFARISSIACAFDLAGFSMTSDEALKAFLAQAPLPEGLFDWKAILDVAIPVANALVPIVRASLKQYLGPAVAMIIDILVKIGVVTWENVKEYLELSQRKKAASLVSSNDQTL